MKKRVIILLLLLIIAGIIFGIYHYRKLQQERANKDHVTAYGNVDVRQVNIAFRVAGYLEKMLVEEGDWVHAGDLLAELDVQPYQDQMAEAEAQLAVTLTGVENANLLLARRKELIGIGGVSQEDLDDATARYAMLVAESQATNASLRVMQDNLSYTHVYAPHDGMIITRIREPGSVVNAGEPVYTLTLVSPVWVQAFVPEPDLGRIRYGMKAKITTDTPSAPVYEGVIGFISPVAEFTPKMVQTTDLRPDLVYRVRIRVDNQDQGLKQGMPVTVQIQTSS